MRVYVYDETEDDLLALMKKRGDTSPAYTANWLMKKALKICRKDAEFIKPKDEGDNYFEVTGQDTGC